MSNSRQLDNCQTPIYVWHMSNSERLLSTREVASCLGVHVRAVSRLVAADKLAPAIVAPGGPHGTYLFDPAVVDEYKRERGGAKRVRGGS
nr:hypothetical protein GCM10023233_27530 [Brevibacterium otitidis]